MSTGPIEQDPVWRALEGVRDTAPVRDARRYARLRAAQRRRLFAWRQALGGWAPRGALAAGLAVLAAFLLLPQSETLETRVGEIRRVALEDGSVVLLNTGSRLEIRYGWWHRDAELLAGEARFDVAHDVSRPFRVRANGMMVTALGTSFDVLALSRRTAVTLIDGQVLVESDRDASGQRRLAAPGQQVRLAPGGLSQPVVARLDAALAWQRRLVDLSGLPLADALEEVNRYSRVKVVVAAPDLRDRQISGVFRAGDVDAVGAALGAYFDLQIMRRDADRLVLARSPPAARPR